MVSLKDHKICQRCGRMGNRGDSVREYERLGKRYLYCWTCAVKIRETATITDIADIIWRKRNVLANR